MDFFRKLFAPKQSQEKQTMDFLAKLSLEFMEAYQKLVRDTLSNSDKANLIQMKSGSKSDFTADLSSEGIEYLLNNVPSSVAALVQQQKIETLKGALSIVNALEQDTSAGVGLNPTITKLTRMFLAREIKKWAYG